MMEEGGKTARDRIDFAYQLVLARSPKPPELQVVLDALAEFETRYHADKKSAKNFVAHGDSPWNQKLDARELAAYTSIASLLLNLDESVTKQ
jgi:hypothetical protein